MTAIVAGKGSVGARVETVATPRAARPSGSIAPLSPAKYAVILLVLLAAALLSRAPMIGALNPLMDDQFYLLVADRMWHGAMPYVDIWDRKPIGLFLLYAAFRPLSSDGVVAYQVAALCFVMATALVIVQLGRRLGSLTAAVAAGALYIVYLPIVGGGVGESPVFYNLFVTLAAFAVVKGAEGNDGRSIAFFGLLAMLLVGIAIQVKYTAFVEGIGFGLFLLWLYASRSHRITWTLGLAVALAATALLPTLIAFLYFVSRGFGAAFFHANFVSIFQAKEPPKGGGATGLQFLCQTGIRMTPMLVTSVAGLVLGLRAKDTSRTMLPLIGWCMFALAGFAIIGRFYGHYALPMLVPLSLAAIPILESPIAGGIILVVAYIFAGAVLPVPRDQGNQYIERLVAVLKPYTAHGCLYLRDGPPIVYLLTESCLPTPYVFPEHLVTAMEARATSATANMTRLLAGRPSAIMLSDHWLQHAPNLETQRLLATAIASDYRLVATVAEPNGVDHGRIYARADLVPRGGDAGARPPASRDTK